MRIPTPMMQIDKLINSALAIGSPRNRKAIIVANIGEVLFRNATFDSEINLTAMLNTKKVIVSDIDLIITSLH
jgi:hypothetical protein